MREINEPGSLDGFPSRTLRPGTILYRTHIPGSPLLYSSTSYGRFNLHGDEGTAYIAEDASTTLAQYIAGSAGTHRTVHDEHLASLQLTVYRLDVAQVVADAGQIDALRKFGGSPLLFTTPEAGWAWTQRWATAFRKAGFDGINFSSRYQVGDEVTYLSLFGPTGQHPPMTPVSAVVDLREVSASIGYTVQHTPMKSQLAII